MTQVTIEEQVRGMLRNMADDVPSRTMPPGLARRGRRLATMRFGGGFLILAVIIVSVLSLVPQQGGAPPGDVANKSQEGSPKEESKQLLRSTGEIAFIDQQGQPSIVIEDLDDSKRTQVFQADNITGIDWSPDGRLLVAGVGLGEGNSSIVIIDPREGTQTALVTGDDVFNPQDPNWSADGEQIAFSNGTGDIYVVDRMGENLRQITRSGDRCSDLYPSWSPDGLELVFTRECGAARIFKVALEQGEPEPLTSGPADYQPAWSPDGAQIAFSRDNIFLVDPAGDGEVQITQVPENWEPEWSSDGKVIVFASNRDGNQELYAINADGTSEERLTNSRGDETTPIWRPLS